jgi:hypothetical protein
MTWLCSPEPSQVNEADEMLSAGPSQYEADPELFRLRIFDGGLSVSYFIAMSDFC